MSSEILSKSEAESAVKAFAGRKAERGVDDPSGRWHNSAEAPADSTMGVQKQSEDCCCI